MRNKKNCKTPSTHNQFLHIHQGFVGSKKTVGIFPQKVKYPRSSQSSSSTRGRRAVRLELINPSDSESREAKTRGQRATLFVSPFHIFTSKRKRRELSTESSRLVLVLLGALDLLGTAELLGAVLPLLAWRGCEYKRKETPGESRDTGKDVRCCLLGFSILVAAPMRTRR